LFVVDRNRKMHFGYSTTLTNGENIMSIERLVRNAGFALAALAIVFAVGITIEYQPVINALAR
jgi:hypothetical protein